MYITCCRAGREKGACGRLAVCPTNGKTCEFCGHEIVGVDLRDKSLVFPTKYCRVNKFSSVEPGFNYLAVGFS